LDELKHPPCISFKVFIFQNQPTYCWSWY